MNKTELINTLSKELKYNIKDCKIICNTLEENFFLSKKNKNKIINELKINLKVDDKEADNIYEKSISIIKNEIKNKIKHPFKSQR